jgi:transcriptional regulator with XRE-family HTH domain
MSVSSVAARTPAAQPPIGRLLREWRAALRFSQMDLAMEAGVSTRHLSCIETGKAQASREILTRLADALAMPLRERNALLTAAGYAPKYPETTLDTPELEQMQKAIELILAKQEPYPAFVINRHFDVLRINQATARIDRLTMGRPSRHTNLLHQVFDPDDFRPVIANWHEVAEGFIGHLHHQIAASPADQRAQQLLDEILRYPDVPTRWRFRDVDKAPSPIQTMRFRSPEGELRFFETITTFALPRDVTLDEMRIECAFPADEHTAAVCARLAEGDPPLS